MEVEIISKDDGNNPEKTVAKRIGVDYSMHEGVMALKFWPKGIKIRGWWLRQNLLGAASNSYR